MPKTRRLTGTYFDTPDRALLAQGLVLRVREADGRFIQTVKSAPGQDAALTRGEWEDTVTGPQPDPTAPVLTTTAPPACRWKMRWCGRSSIARASVP